MIFVNLNIFQKRAKLIRTFVICEFLIEKNITFEKNVKIDKIITKSPFHHFNEYKKKLFYIH